MEVAMPFAEDARPQLNEAQAAARLGVKPAALRQMRQRGQGPAYFKIGRSVRYDPVDLEEYIGRCRIVPHIEPGAEPRQPYIVLSATKPLEDLTAACLARRRGLRLSQLDVDHLAGWADGYQAKLEASLTNPAAKNARMIGRESLPLLLGALKLRLAVVPDKPLPIPGERYSRIRIADLESLFARQCERKAAA
jgi:hypothetical protein